MSVEARYQLHPCLRFRWDPPHTCQLLPEGREVEVPRDLARLLFRITAPAATQDQLTELAAAELDLPAATASALVHQLVASGIVVADTASAPAASWRWVNHGWLHALLLHLSRRPASVAATPATPDAPPRRATGIALPAPVALIEGQALERLLPRRRTHGPMVRNQLALGELSSLLAQVQLVMARPGPARALVPSIGVYCLAFSIDALAPGLYRYDASRHVLELVRTGDLRRALQTVSFGQPQVSAGCCAIAMTVRWSALLAGDAADRLRRVHITFGQIGHRLQLMATQSGLATFLSSGVAPRAHAELLGVPHEEEALRYLTAVG